MMNVRILALFFILYLFKGISCACTPYTPDFNNGSKGGESFIDTFWPDDCLPTVTTDRLYYQKQVTGTWINLFECTASNLDGAAIDKGSGYGIHGRSTGKLSASNRGHKLTITNTSACDSGSWRLSVKHGDETSSSDPIEFDIYDIVKPTDIKVTSSTYLAGEDIEFSCKIASTRPRASVSWTFNSNTEGTGDVRDTKIECAPDMWSIHNVKTKRFDQLEQLDFRCITDQRGTINQSDIHSIDIKAPPKIVEEISIDKPIPLANESFTLTCIASGTDVELFWTRNDEPIYPYDGYFEEPVVTDESRNDLDFGQTVAKKSVLTSVAFDNPDADSFIKQSGNFTCQAMVDEFPARNTKSVHLYYTPLPNGDSVVPVDVTEKSTVKMECNVTAYPLPSYEWLKADVDLALTSRIVIIDVTESSNFTCKATNPAGSAAMYFLVRVELSAGLSDGAIAGICISVIGACIAALLAVVYFLYKKKQQGKADEEVTAYAESGNTRGANNGVNVAKGANTATTPPVYAEVDKNKKKKSPTNTAAPVYSEVNKDKNKQQNTREPADAVYSQVHKQDRPLPHLKPKPGSTKTGPVYSEANKPKQGRLTPIENQHYDNAGKRNEHGALHYADVDFLRQGNAGTKASHGTKNPSYEPTEYAQIDHRKSAGIVV